jgi:hypothetical protein
MNDQLFLDKRGPGAQIREPRRSELVKPDLVNPPAPMIDVASKPRVHDAISFGEEHAP